MSWMGRIGRNRPGVGRTGRTGRMTWGTAMGGQGSKDQGQDRGAAGEQAGQRQPGAGAPQGESATAAAPQAAGAAPQAAGAAPQTAGAAPQTAAAALQTTAATGRHKRRRSIWASLLGALGVTVISLVFMASFIGGLHDPGPRSVPVGIVGPASRASALRTVLSHQVPGAFTVTSYSTPAAARNGILDRSVNAALMPGPAGEVLVVASAVGNAVTNATIKDFAGLANAASVRLLVQDIRPLPSNDPEGLSQVFFVTALLAPSILFGWVLVSRERVGRDLHPLLQLAVIAVYAAIVAAVATAFADPVIGALTGAPWGMFGIGTLLAFAAAASSAAVGRWAGGVGYLLLFLLLIPIGLSASGTTLGPNMITQWYADLGKALPAGSALPAVQNTVYFNGNAITTPLLILSAWAVAATIALALVAILRPPMPGQWRNRAAHAAPGYDAASPAPVRSGGAAAS